MIRAYFLNALLSSEFTLMDGPMNPVVHHLGNQGLVDIFPSVIWGIAMIWEP